MKLKSIRGTYSKHENQLICVKIWQKDNGYYAYTLEGKTSKQELTGNFKTIEDARNEGQKIAREGKIGNA